MIPSIDVKNAMSFMNGQSSGEGPNPTWGFRSPGNITLNTITFFLLLLLLINKQNKTEIDNTNIAFTIAEDNQNCYNGFEGLSANGSGSPIAPASLLMLLVMVMVAFMTL